MWLAALWCGSLLGQSGGDVLRGVGEKVAQMGTYAIEFTLKAEGIAPSSGECVVTREGLYRIELDGMIQGFDGESVWVVNPAAEEITLDAPNLQSRSLFDNPAKAFEFAEELFEVEKVAHEAAMIHLYLVPKEGVLDGVDRVHLVVDEATSLPASLGYEIGGATLYVVVERMEACAAVPNRFELPIREYPDFEIIDFR